MILKRIKVNTALGEPTNCYIVEDEQSKETMVIDPGGEPEKIIDMLNTLGIDQLKYIYLTHCHGDHFGGILELKKQKGGKVVIHRDDAEGLYNPSISMTYYIGMEDIELEADSRVDEGDTIHLGKLEFKVIHTPGHTKGGSCLYCKEQALLFSGDTLFKGTWGRTDLPTSSFPDIIASITNKLATLPDDTIVYPRTWKINKNKRGRTNLLNLKTKIRLKNGTIWDSPQLGRMGQFGTPHSIIKGDEKHEQSRTKNFTRFYGIITKRTNFI